MNTRLVKILSLVFFANVFLLFNCQNGHAQAVETYRVLGLKGEVLNKTRNVKLAKNSAFQSTDLLVFADKKGWMIVVDQARKTYAFIRADNPKGYVSKPFQKAQNTRPGMILNESSLQTYLGVDTLVILGGSLRVPVSPRKFPQDETSFFVVRFEWQGEMIDKKVPFDGNELIIDEALIYQIDGEALPLESIGKQELLYYNGTEPALIRIGPINPVFVPADVLLEDINLLLEFQQNVTPEEEVDFINEFLRSYYGPLNEQNFKHWYQENFGG